MAQTKTISVTKINFDFTDGNTVEVECSLRIGELSNGNPAYLTLGAILSDELRGKIMQLIEDDIGSQIGATPHSTAARREFETA
jgi:hypothetical protein